MSSRRRGSGELVRMVLDTLRVAPVPMSSKEIAAAVMVRRALDPADMHSARLVCKLVNNALARQAGDLVEKIALHRSVTWRVRR